MRIEDHPLYNRKRPSVTDEDMARIDHFLVAPIEILQIKNAKVTAANGSVYDTLSTNIRPDIREWCDHNLKGRIRWRRWRGALGSKPYPIRCCVLDFENVNDITLFKVFWC